MEPSGTTVQNGADKPSGTSSKVKTLVDWVVLTIGNNVYVDGDLEW